MNWGNLEEPLDYDGGLTPCRREERKEVPHGLKKILARLSGSP